MLDIRFPKPYHVPMSSSVRQCGLNMCECISFARTHTMGVAMILVMLFHMGTPYFSIFGHWGVDIFMFVSGFGIYHALNNHSSVSSFYKRRLVRVMPAAIISGIVIAAINYGFNYVAVQDFFLPYGVDYVLWGCGLHLWYIRSILILYLLAPFLFLFIRKRLTLPLFILIILSLLPLCYALQSMAPLFPRTCRLLYLMTTCWTIVRFPAFLCGMIVACYGTKYKINAVRDASLALLLLCISIVIRNFSLDGALPGSNASFIGILWNNTQYLLIIPSIILLCVGMGYTASYLSETNIISIVLRWIGQHSLEIYVVHEAVYRVLKRLLLESFLMLYYPVLAILLSMILARLLKVLAVYACRH